MDKEFKTIEEQIEILKRRKLNLNEENASKILRNNNYYYLINGYKDLFVVKTNDGELYMDGVNLEEIYSLYKFDSELRINLLKYILIIERRMDTYIAYEFSKQYGYKNYLLEDNFNNTNANIENITKLISEVISDMEKQIQIGNRMLNHYMNQYGYVPFWVLIRIMTFGEISKFFGLMKQKDQNAISKNFNVKEKILKSYLGNLAIVRNLCAHDEKLYDIRLRKSIASTQYHELLNLSNTGYKDLFSTIIILKSLLEEKDFTKFYNILINDLEELKENVKSISFDKVLYKMGFPKNYKDLLIM